MIKVELINKEEIKNIFKNHGEFATVCYNTPKKFAEKIGKHCVASGHFSGSRCEYFKFEIRGISRACSLQLNRHNVGVVLNQQSQRYVDMSTTEFVIPPQIAKSEKALAIYSNLAEQSKQAYVEIQKELVNSGRNNEQANEDARFALLESCETCGTWGFTLEALIHFMNKRLCTRSQWEIRQLAIAMKLAVLEVLPELGEYLVPHCVSLLYCPESKKQSCGKFPVKIEVAETLKRLKKDVEK